MSKKDLGRFQITDVPFKEDLFDGIFRFFYSVPGRDPIGLSIITITCSSKDASMHQTINGWYDRLIMPNNFGEWWKVDFGLKTKVCVNALSILSTIWGANSFHIKDFKIEGCNDDMSWEPVTVLHVGNSLNESYCVETFSCPLSAPFRYLCLTLVFPNAIGTWQISFSKIEFFGELHQLE
jgi:hypothetical protein